YLDQMANTASDLNSKECSHCGRDKIRIEFISSYGDRGGKESEYSNCNDCAEKKRKSSNSELAELEELVADYFTNIKEDQIKFLKNFELEDEY
ncbi:575_t:CDS:2, partial [Dentiscutata erythropus]